MLEGQSRFMAHERLRTKIQRSLVVQTRSTTESSRMVGLPHLATGLFLFCDDDRRRVGAHKGTASAQGWPLLIPVIVVIVQWIRPTILGWAVICLPTLIYISVGACYIITENLGPHPQWERDPSGVVLGSLFLGVLLASCILLIFAARPRAFSGTMPHDKHGSLRPELHEH
jgi:hypothetical protein